jgi:copper chaperone CopZ
MEYKLKIDGMSCDGCVKNISKIMTDFSNVKKVNVNLENHSAIISTTSKFDADSFINRFNGTKFTVQILNNDSKPKASFISKLKNLI